MRHLLILSLLLLHLGTCWAQQSPDYKATEKQQKAGSSHCHPAEEPAVHTAAPQPSATAQFASFASDAAFRGLHDEPQAYTHQTTTGKEITFPTPDGSSARAFAYMTQKKSSKYLLVIHEWWGLNDHIKREAERYYKELGVNVLALDMYDGKVATTREEAQQLTQSLPEERARAIIQGALNLAGKDAKIGTLGWCFGGGWSLQAAMMAGKQAEACVIYYGMPEQDVQKLKSLQCDVLGIFAKQDGRITPEVVAAFQANMEKADKKLEVKMYDAQHGFANPSSAAFKETAAENALKITLAYLKEQMK